MDGIISKQHDKSHSIVSTGDHSSAATEDQILMADANGLPVDATNTDAEVADAVTKKHSPNADTDLDSTFEDTFLKHTDVDDVPIDGVTTDPISSNWAYDLTQVTREPTGFPNLTDTSAPTFSSPTVTLAKTGTSFDFYIKGVKYTKSANQTVNLPNGDATDIGTWYIYFNAAGTLTATKTTAWDIASADSCPVAVLFFNGAAGRICDERHGTVMDAATHDLLHYTVGCRYESGLAGTFTDPTAIAIALGVIHDEDLEYSFGAKTQCVPFYHSSGVYTFGNAQNSYRVVAATILQYDNLTNLADVTNNKYVAYWIFATMDTLTPIWAMPGQREDTLLKDARDNNKYESLSLGVLPFPEMKLLYRVLLQRTTGAPGGLYVETQDLRTVSNLSSGTYVATDHGALTGLLDDDHTQYLLTDGTRAMAADINMGTNQVVALSVPDAAGEAIRQTAKITETALEDAIDKKHVDIGARVTHSVAQAIQHNTWTVLAFDTERWDTDGMHSTVDNNSRLTCKTAGKYLIIGCSGFPVGAGAVRSCYIGRAGAIWYASYAGMGSLTVGNEVVISTIMDMAVDDYVELWVYQNSGGPLNSLKSDFRYPEFMAQKLA